MEDLPEEKMQVLLRDEGYYMKKYLLATCLVIIIVIPAPLFSWMSVMAQDDTVQAVDTSEPPVIDGDGGDDCWLACPWQSIDQVWIEYGVPMDPADFSGKYKVLWSASTNLLYFLVEIVDDVFVDGYVYNSDPGAGGGYPNFDIVEVFIDQDKSGGLHVFDGIGSTGQQWGTNAENAFSYHIAADLGQQDQIMTNKTVCDIAGVSWVDYYIANYKDHFPEFALAYKEGKYFWEFSLAVYNDTYQAADPEAARVLLKNDDVLGLSLAYCDNDDPDEEPKERDNFIGSVWVPAEAYNDHWMNADGFGTLKLLGSTTAIREDQQEPVGVDLQLYPNPSHGTLQFKIGAHSLNTVNLKIYTILGQKVLELKDIGERAGVEKKLSLQNLSPGIYIFSARLGNQQIVKKFVLLK